MNQPIILFFDTEFTVLNQSDAELISTGIVDLSRTHEFYAELEHDPDKVSDFAFRVFYTFLKGIAKPADEVNASLLAWLSSIRKADEEIVFYCDFEQDERLLRWLLEDNRDWIRIENINALIIRHSWMEESFHEPEGEDPLRHHALPDAYLLREKYIKASNETSLGVSCEDLTR